MTFRKLSWRWVCPRFSLRAMLVVVTLCCLWLGWQVNRAARQRDAVVAVKALDGRVVYSSEFPESAAKRLIRQWLGRDYVDDVIEVGFPQSRPVSDTDLSVLRALPKLKVLSLICSRVTDDGLDGLRWASHLERLELLRTKVTDDGLAHLTKLKRLKWLWLNETKITDAGLAHLKRLPEIEVLLVGGNQISDAGLENLKGLRSLREIEVGCKTVTAEGATRLQRSLPQCKIIHWGYPAFRN
jgi:hypothetical protein